MLKQQAAIGNLAADSPGVHGPLQVPAAEVVHGGRTEACVRVNEFSIHSIEITTRVRPPRRVGMNQTVINEADLRQMSPGERRKLARSLAAIDYPQPLLGIYLARGRRFGALISIACCTVLAGWIIVLLPTLHRTFHAQHWRGAWVGFDLVLLVAFALTGWAFWRGRQIVIALLVITATLLCCDAWFDVVLDAGSSDVWGSVASAVFVELPIALLMFNAARRLIRLSALIPLIGSAEITDHPEDKLPPLWKIPLFGLRPAAADPASLSRADRTRSG
jgi:hypothetical protein